MCQTLTKPLTLTPNHDPNPCQVGRVALHDGMSDPLRAQRLGMWIWIFCVVTACLMDACANVIAPEEICRPTPNRFLR